MGTFTAQEIENYTASLLDFHFRGSAQSQIDQVRPLFDDLKSMQEFFPGGKEYIDKPVKGRYTSAFRGYTHDDEQEYVNPANTRRVKAPWYELGAGISFTGTELKKAGISVVDSLNGASTTQHPKSDMVVLTNLLNEKIEDLKEGSERSMAEIQWRDGTQDAKVYPGVLSFMPATAPASQTGITFGIDRATNSWWRTRYVGSISVTTPSDANLANTLQKEYRQLRRYAKNPKHRFYAGSDFLDALEKELRAKGTYTLDGWAKSGTMDLSVADPSFKGMKVVYEPLLDDLSLAKEGFILDLNAIKLMPMSGEDYKQHNPARPPEKYVYYRAVTWTGALMAQQLNSSGRYAIA